MIYCCLFAYLAFVSLTISDMSRGQYMHLFMVNVLDL